MMQFPLTPEVSSEQLVASEEERNLQLSSIREKLADAELQAYLAFTPSNVQYVSGYESYFLSNWWRMHGKIFSAISLDESHVPVLVLGDAEDASEAAEQGTDVMSYRMWVEPSTLQDVMDTTRTTLDRPAQWSEESIDGVLRDILRKFGITRGRVGADLRHMTFSAYERLVRVAPDVEWVDFTEAMYSIRAIKQPYEVARLQAAVELADEGMLTSISYAQEGASLADIHSGFIQGVVEKARSDAKYAGFSTYWVIPAFGKASNINAKQAEVMRHGDLIKFDCGTTVDGYRSDHGRTFVLGRPSQAAERLYNTLKAAHDSALSMIRPGVVVSEVFTTAEAMVRENGYPNYNRGHFGHSVGMDSFHEEPPFLGRKDSDVIHEGMVLAVETPFYGSDVGSIMLEDLVLVTASGIQLLSRLPRNLVCLDGR